MGDEESPTECNGGEATGGVFKRAKLSSRQPIKPSQGQESQLQNPRLLSLMVPDLASCALQKKAWSDIPISERVERLNMVSSYLVNMRKTAMKSRPTKTPTKPDSPPRPEN